MFWLVDSEHQINEEFRYVPQQYDQQYIQVFKFPNDLEHKYPRAITNISDNRMVELLQGFRVMFLLWVGGPMESHEIARLAGLSRAAISSAVNTLERDGLVDRRRESDDRRVVTVYLTDDGAERLEAAYRAQNAREGALLGGLDADELSTLTDLMRRVSSTRIDD